MKLSKLAQGLYGCLFWAAALTGCTVETGFSTRPPPPEEKENLGSITVQWTIASTAAPAQCAYYRVDSLQLVVYDESGAEVVSTHAPCEAFTVQIELSPGTYHADATLVDVNKRPRSLTLPLNDLRVTAGTDLAVDTDFPARSLL
jgi:hypothetical protein